MRPRGRSHDRAILIGLLVSAVLLRVGVRLWLGEAEFLTNGYSFYVNIATNVVSGDGFCVSPGHGCGLRVPGYPLFLAAFLSTTGLYPAIIVVQSLVGAVTVWLTWGVGLELFDRRAALLAAGMTAFHPYFVIHDTALQDTVLLNALLLAAVWLLLRAGRSGSETLCVAAGVLLAAAVLTTVRVMFFLPVAIGWMALAGGAPWNVRVRNAALVFVPIALLIGGWTIRNARVVGAPVLTTEAGESLWAANNPATFLHFPERSIDRTVVASYASLGPYQQSELAKLDEQEVARDRLLAQWAVEYVAANVLQTFQNSVRKVWVALSAQYSPARSSLVQMGYAAFMLPIHLLALLALWHSRAGWTTHGLIIGLFVSFVVTTAIFWAHTSHKSYLDPVLFVYAASFSFNRTASVAGRFPL